MRDILDPVTVAFLKSIPDTAVSRAEAAQAAAEAAAQEAASHNYGITVSGTVLTITEPT